MSFKSARVIDGYTLPTANNYFICPWLDLHSAPYFNIKITFAGSAPDGYLTLEESDDREAQDASGRTCPQSALLTGGLGAFGNPIDLSTTSGTSVLVTATGVTTYSLGGTATARFYRVKFTPAVSGSGVVVTVTYSYKTSS